MLPWLEVDRLVTLFVLITSGLELIIFSDEQLRISTADNSQTQRPHIIRRHGQLSLPASNLSTDFLYRSGRYRRKFTMKQRRHKGHELRQNYGPKAKRPKPVKCIRTIMVKVLSVERSRGCQFKSRSLQYKCCW